MFILGVDYSVNSPGITRFSLDDNLDIINKKYVGFTNIKKNEFSNDEGTIFHYKKKQFKNSIEQNLWIIDKIQTITKIKSGSQNIIDYSAFEDYAYGAKGKVFNIAESTGVYKTILYNDYVNIRLYEPSVIKMFFTQMGNADKMLMDEFYEKLNKKDKFDLSMFDDGKSPKADIIDSFAIAKLLQLELKLRKGLIKLKSLPEKTIGIFNRCTKKYPENILVRNFIYKLIKEL